MSENENVDEAAAESGEGVATVDAPSPAAGGLERVVGLTVPVTVELGRAKLSVQDILELTTDSVIELDHAADSPVELLVHGKCVARGEIVVVDDYYGVRISEIVGG